MITTETKLVGLLGYPLKQSFSPEMHNKNFGSLGLDYYYFPIEVENDKLEDVVKGIKNMNFAGFNVTKPNKVKILEYLDEVNELAQKIGSVNTVKNVNGKLVGYNTDGEGFVEALRAEMNVDPKGTKFTILGAGGASRAIAVTLAYQGAGQIIIIDKYNEVAKDLVDHINKDVAPCAKLAILDDDDLKASVADCQVLINASGVGMYPYLEQTPVKKEWLNPSIIVCDCTYNPLKTRLLIEAEEVGCKTQNGIGMMINQGAKAFEVWTGMDSPVETMTKIVNQIVERVTQK
ncbi:MAG: shikimate dehydrogenase [Bacillota bacterium]